MLQNNYNEKTDISFGDLGFEFSEMIDKKRLEGNLRRLTNINWILKPLYLIRIKEGYDIDAFVARSSHESQSFFYCHTKNATVKYNPSERRVKLGVAKQLPPNTIDFEELVKERRYYVPSYEDTMLVKDNISYGAASCIPDFWNYLTVPFSPMGVWQAFLLNEAWKMFPLGWHALYCEDMINFKPGKSIFEKIPLIQKYHPEIVEQIIVFNQSPDVLPKVTINDNTAMIHYTFWNNYWGFVKAIKHATWNGKFIEFDERETEVLVEYKSRLTL